MNQEIKEIYHRLSGGKNIEGDAYVIAPRQFSSVLLDRFVAELSKMGVKWDRRDIAFGELMAGRTEGATEGTRAPKAMVVGAVEEKTADFAIGIDIQHIAELPDCVDYWEDPFYKMKFTPEEIAYGVTRNDPKETFAGIYSCKEALVKCNHALDWKSIAIGHDADGAPTFADYHLSISHSAGTAIAVAVLQKAGDRSAPDTRDRGIEKGNTDADKGNQLAEERGLPGATKVLFVLLSLVILYLLYRDLIR